MDFPLPCLIAGGYGHLWGKLIGKPWENCGKYGISKKPMENGGEQDVELYAQP
jgi:hypothetical protein